MLLHDDIDAAEIPRQLLQQVVDAMRDAVVVTSSDGTIVYVNPAFTRLTGYGADEAIGANPRILRSGQQSEEFYRDLWDTVLSGETWHGEVVNRRKDGSIYADDMTIVPFVVDDDVTHMIATKRDVDATLSAMARSSPVGIGHLASDGRLLYANPMLEDLLGHSYLTLVGHKWIEAIGPDDRPKVLSLIAGPHHDDHRVETIRLPDDRVGTLRVATLDDVHGTVIGMVVSLVDATEEVRARDLAVAREQFAHAIIDGLQDPTVVIDQHGGVLHANAEWRSFVDAVGGDRDAATLAGAMPASIDGAVEVGQLADVNLDDGYDVEAVREIRTIDERGARWWLVRATGLSGGSGRILTWTDITRRKHQELELTARADHDPLTGLANREATQRWLHDALDDGPVGVLFMDLDGFKQINDDMGHHAGDELLLTITRRLVTVSRPTDLVARFGGDEFLVLMAGIDDEKVIETAAQRFRDVVEQPAALTAGQANVGVSIGMAVARPGADPVAVLSDADERMYADKRSRNT